MSKTNRPAAKVRAAPYPQWSKDTTLVDIVDPVTGASATLEIGQFCGSLKIQLHAVKGAVHLCGPVQCVWSSRYDGPNDQEVLDARRTGRRPVDAG
jgi:hypothetical protein